MISGKQTLDSCPALVCHGNPLLSFFFFGLTAVLLDARFVPRNFYDIFVWIFQYVGTDSHSTALVFVGARA